MAGGGGNRPFNTDSETVVAVMGPTGSGKSTFINLVSGAHLAVSESLRSCTNQVTAAEPFELSGHPITLVDTPGFDDTMLSDTDVLKMIAAYLSSSYEQGFKLSGVIYMHRITDRRVTGMSRRNFGMLRNLCGDDTLKNVAIVTNMWDQELEERGSIREKELMTDSLFFKPMLDKGARMLRHNNTVESARELVAHFIKKPAVTLRIQRELVEQHMNIQDTAAGIAVQDAIEILRGKHQEELLAVRQELEGKQAKKDAELRSELEEVRKELQRKIEALERDKERLAREYLEAKKQADEEINKLIAKKKNGLFARMGRLFRK